ncbi:MAG: hypothetical protein F4Z29_14755 [Gemmatimonadetes bacterium]|nr:hypothetical protein [Gemmatimonadota bacterium]
MRQTTIRYLLELGASTLAYVVVQVVSLMFLRENPDSPWRIPVTVSPVIPLVFMMLAVVRFVRRMDEMLRHLHLEAVLIAYITTVILCISYGLLENVGFPTFNTMWVGFAMILLWSVGQLVAGRKYR